MKNRLPALVPGIVFIAGAGIDPITASAQVESKTSQTIESNASLIKYGPKVRYHVRIENIATNPDPGRPCRVVFMTQIPRPTPWNARTSVGQEAYGDIGGSEMVRLSPWNRPAIYTGAENLRFTPYAPVTVHVAKDAIHPLSRKVWPDTWETERLAQCYWMCQVESTATSFTHVVEFDITSCSRRLNVEATGLTVEDLAALPEPLKKEVALQQAKLPADIRQLAVHLAAGNTKLTTIVEKLNEWVGKTTYAADEYPGGPYLYRYDLASAVKNKRGWCGPRATILRALCLAIGIPAREVNGYGIRKADGVVDEPINAENGIGNAHVWAEIYLPTVGWVEVSPASKVFEVSANFIRVYEEEDPWGLGNAKVNQRITVKKL